MKNTTWIVSDTKQKRPSGWRTIQFKKSKSLINKMHSFGHLSSGSWVTLRVSIQWLIKIFWQLIKVCSCKVPGPLQPSALDSEGQKLNSKAHSDYRASLSITQNKASNPSEKNPSVPLSPLQCSRVSLKTFSPFHHFDHNWFQSIWSHNNSL